MFLNSNLKKIFIFSLIFSILIFFLKYSIIEEEKYELSDEEYYIDRTLDKEIEIVNEKDILNSSSTGIIEEEENKEIKKEIMLEKYKEDLEKVDNNKNKISYIYIPSSLRLDITEHTIGLSSFITSKYFLNKIEDLIVEFYKELVDVRGKMKSQKIKLFGPIKMGKEEILSVFTHELGHYIDLYYFTNTTFGDTSDEFYKISWNSTTVMKEGQKNLDFVSGYSMTNKYEDFAESFIYYILHNKDFLKKTEKSKLLKEKYYFFKIYLFNKEEFYLTNFGTNSEIKDYYRDITKIKVNLDNILQYLGK